jgi:macrolide-specific efflux system membrane fusion protein
MNEKGSSRLALNLGLAVVLVAIGVGTYLVLGRGDDGSAQGLTATATVSRGAVRSTASASGTIQSAETVGASFVTGGTVTDLLVDLGDHVREGQVLARVDDTGAQADLSVAYANANSAQAGVTSARAGISSAQAGVTSAQATLSSAQEDLRELRRSGEATDAQIADAETQVTAARSQVEQAQASLTSAYSQVSQAEASVTSASAQVTEAQEAVSGTTLRAPIAGTVVEVNGAVGQTASTGGTTSDSTSSDATASSDASGTSGFVVISDLEQLEVFAYFSETDTASIEDGQRATVTLNAQPDVRIRGTVIAIDEMATTVNQVVNYGVTIALEDVPGGVRVGQTAVAVVVTGRARDVLTVPSTAVRTSGGQSTVTVLRDGQEVPTVIEIGLEGDQTTEVVSGLSEGDEVVVASASDSGDLGDFPGGGFPGLGGAPVGGAGP